MSFRTLLLAGIGVLANIPSVIATETPPDLPGENEPAPNIVGETLGDVKKNTRYTIQELKENFPPIEEWAGLGVKPDPDQLASSYAKDRFKAPPPPGVHPRVYFNPEDLPVIRQRLQTSRIARTRWELIRGRLLQISPNREDWEDVPYSTQQVEAKTPDYLTDGRRINRRMGYHGPWVGGWVNDLAAGKDPEELAGNGCTWPADPTAPFEGLNKSSYAPKWLLPLAKRRANFIGTEWSKNHVRRFQLGVMLPWGREFVCETGIGSPRDMAPFKCAHPEDPIVDLIYAGTVLPLLEPDARPVWTNIRTTYAPWWPQVVINDDPLGYDGQAYDFDTRFDVVMADLRQQGEPLTYYSDYRGLLTTRTGWDRNEVFLYFEPRNVPGGHTRDSRNEFVLAAHGRLWATRTTAVEDSSELHSVMLIDGQGQGHQCPQGKTVAMVDEPLATFCAGDARWAYSYAAGGDDDQPVRVTPNDSRLKPSPLPWMDQPWNFLPAWNTDMKGGGRHGHWREHNPIQYAYRTAGLIRGKHSYAIIIDDYRKDDGEHLYQWLMQVPEDVQIVGRSAGTPGRDKVLDLVLGEREGDRRLLLRVLAAGTEPAEAKRVQTAAKLESYDQERRGNVTTYQRISLPLKSARGHFVVLLYPHRQGQPLPTTAWSGTSAKISWPDQADKYGLSVGADGRTRIKLDGQGWDALAVE